MVNAACSATRPQSQFASQGPIVSLNQDGISSDLQATDVDCLGASGNATVLAFCKGPIVDDSQFGVTLAGNALQSQSP